MNLANNVHKGAQLLDRKMPGWFQRIDLDKLCMSDGTVCVLGQVFDKAVHDHWNDGYAQFRHGYDLALDEWHWLGEELDYGFDLPKSADDLVWKELDQLWMAEVKARYDKGFEV